ncbi:MAG: hypothetical protein LBR47_04550 [Spirochaetaceae bacterium]|jgi:hypothetical protein|nr:hypothetical protein [Spirochaetaceae bacterium]
MEYVTDITIIAGNNKDIPAPAGFIKCPQDLNKGASGDYIYLCYKKQQSDTVITDIRISSDKTISGYTRIDVDLNKGAGGDYLYLFYRKDTLGSTGAGGITDITFVTGKNASAPSGYTKIDVDLNKGAGGEYIYLCYKGEFDKSFLGLRN